MKLTNLLTYKSWNEEGSSFATDDDSKGAIEVLRWAYEHYGEEIIYACSFGIEGIVLIDFISKIKPNAKILFLDTGLHFQETYDVIEQIKKRYPYLRIMMEKPKQSVAEQAKEFGDELWNKNPNKCCEMRKIVPLQRALKDVSAWISGLRREQSPTRQNTNFVNKDHRFQSIKICPLIHWTWKEIWRYVYKHDLPYNRLHDQGYPSIGCETCTLPAFDTENLRSGRWAENEKLECGLHES